MDQVEMQYEWCQHQAEQSELRNGNREPGEAGSSLTIQKPYILRKTSHLLGAGEMA